MGYPGTTGLSTVDYRLSDPYLDPPGLYDQFYTEETIRLPDSFWCYEPGSRQPAVNPLPALRSGHVTFGSMNSFCKANDLALELWARVLRSVAGSRLLVLIDSGSHRGQTLEVLEQNGIDPARVQFESRRPRPLYLELYHRIDIALDMVPYSGVTTSLDALLMGVPVICLAGRTAVSRGGLTIMSNIGLPELVAESPDEYVAIAARLAGDLPRLALLRSTLPRTVGKLANDGYPAVRSADRGRLPDHLAALLCAVIGMKGLRGGSSVKTPRRSRFFR